MVAMAATGNSIIYEGAFGPRCVGTAAKMTSDTVFRIASMVKLLTSVAAMQMVERGKLKLDEPAETIDPELATALVLDGFDAKGAPQMRPARKPLTLRNLLTHTSGYTYPLWNADVVRYLKCCKTDKKLPRRPLTFDPDAKWAYGGSIDRVGRLVEIASGMPLGAIFPRQHHRPARDARHRRRPQRQPARARSERAQAPSQRRVLGRSRRRSLPSPTSFLGRRRHLFHRARLSDPAAGAAERRHAQRRHHPEAARRWR